MSTKYRGPIHKTCDRCGCGWPGQFVKFYHDGHTEALCFDCWKPLTWTGGIGVGQCKVLHWINKYGKDSFLPGGTTRPRPVTEHVRQISALYMLRRRHHGMSERRHAREKQ